MDALNTREYSHCSGSWPDLSDVGADGHARQALRAGKLRRRGAVRWATVLIADVVANCWCTASAAILRQYHPVRRAPYGLAGSAGGTWVSPKPRPTPSLVLIGHPEYP